MRIALAQINSTLGDFSGNRQKILECSERARAEKCDLVIFPELSLFGYNAVDLPERASIVKAQLTELNQLKREIPKGLDVVLGVITLNRASSGKPFQNSAVLLHKGSPPKIFSKTFLPTYDVFDDARHFQTGHLKNIAQISGKRVLVTICEDMWLGEKIGGRHLYSSEILKQLKKLRPDLVVNISASPFSSAKEKVRKNVAGKLARALKAPLAYVNMVGAQDELIFDGGSFVCDSSGKVKAQAKFFEEDFKIVEIPLPKASEKTRSLSHEEKLFSALVLGIKDFTRKIGIEKVHFGLSGGIDSAVVAVLAQTALGAKNVHAIALPGPHSAPQSLNLAKELTQNLQISFDQVSISKIYDDILGALKPLFHDFQFGVTHENLQARLRALILMAYSNQKNSMLLGTSNKSELATGYSTLYGDLCGGLQPLGDLVKGEVYSLANFINRNEIVIPKGVIERPPSAELRPNQKDQDSLPEYSLLDASVRKIVEDRAAATTETDRFVLSALLKSEFKRWQAPPILRVTEHAFGRGRRFPVAHRANQ